MHRAALVIVGNEYLAEWARQAGAARVEVLPTVVDLERYPLAQPPENALFTIGWIGTPITVAYLKEIQPALKEICRNGATRVVAIGGVALEMEGVRLEIQPWSELTEVQQIQQFDVGIMPLPDSPWEQGKCGLKLIQYMACACPVIGSPVGINKKLIEHAINGFQPSSTEDWIQAFQILQSDRTLRQHLGKAGRIKVEQEYSLQVTASQLAKLLQEATEI